MKKKHTSVTRRKFGDRPYHNGSYYLIHPYPFWKKLPHSTANAIIHDFEIGGTISYISKKVCCSRRCVSSYICFYYNLPTVWDARRLVKTWLNSPSIFSGETNRE